MKGFIVVLKGKQFVTYKVLLDLAHQKGLISKVASLDYSKDMSYYILLNGTTKVVNIKEVETKEFKIKKKLFEYKYRN